jgi:hypothetical protein
LKIVIGSEKRQFESLINKSPELAAHLDQMYKSMSHFKFFLKDLLKPTIFDPAFEKNISTIFKLDLLN